MHTAQTHSTGCNQFHVQACTSHVRSVAGGTMNSAYTLGISICKGNTLVLSEGALAVCVLVGRLESNSVVPESVTNRRFGFSVYRSVLVSGILPSVFLFLYMIFFFKSSVRPLSSSFCLIGDGGGGGGGAQMFH